MGEKYQTRAITTKSKIIMQIGLLSQVPTIVHRLILDKQTNRQTDKQTNRQTDKQTNRQTGKQANRPTDKQTIRQTDKQTNRQMKVRN